MIGITERIICFSKQRHLMRMHVRFCFGIGGLSLLIILVINSAILSHPMPAMAPNLANQADSSQKLSASLTVWYNIFGVVFGRFYTIFFGTGKILLCATRSGWAVRYRKWLISIFNLVRFEDPQHDTS
jgi:hypothetical protein